jgi:hypothetical protein
MAKTAIENIIKIGNKKYSKIDTLTDDSYDLDAELATIDIAITNYNAIIADLQARKQLLLSIQ